mmetsp:Transcript_13209/g.26032  ORF Transcript_13209/g.26032 Transcript_13209/m.26032 type:complete len:89 (+) Transcript_13209:1391-1657(+)
MRERERGRERERERGGSGGKEKIMTTTRGKERSFTTKTINISLDFHSFPFSLTFFGFLLSERNHFSMQTITFTHGSLLPQGGTHGSIN